MVLKGTYGEMVHETFRMTRQGMRWRFYRLFNQVYVEAFLTILMIEKTFGTQLREYAVTITKERYALREDALIHAIDIQRFAIDGPTLAVRRAARRATAALVWRSVGLRLRFGQHHKSLLHSRKPFCHNQLQQAPSD